MALDIVTRTRDVVASVENPAFIAEIEALLPDTVPVTRFVQVAKTAIRTNPDLVGADENSLFASIVRCAQDGLIPDGHEAALVPYKGKVSYLPMVAGLRKVAAEYGWTVKTAVVYSNDDFDYSEEPAEIRHKPVRPGDDRGERIAAYAVATHRDGRRLQKVMTGDEIAKVRAKAQTQSVWNEWTDQMWMKSPAKAVVKVLPLAERDRIDRLTAADLVTEGETAAELLYGPVREIPAVGPAPADTPQGGGAADSGERRQQATAATTDGAAVAPGDIEEGEFEVVDESLLGEITAEEFAAAAATRFGGGAYNKKTFAEVAEMGADGHEYLGVKLKKTDITTAHGRKLAVFIHEQLPDVWAAYEQWRETQS